MLWQSWYDRLDLTYTPRSNWMLNKKQNQIKRTQRNIDTELGHSRYRNIVIFSLYWKQYPWNPTLILKNHANLKLWASKDGLTTSLANPESQRESTSIRLKFVCHVIPPLLPFPAENTKTKTRWVSDLHKEHTCHLQFQLLKVGWVFV